MAEQEGSAGRGGLLHSIRDLASSLLSAAHTRLEIFSTEIEEERLRLEQLLLLMIFAAICLGMGLLLCVAFVIIYYWDTHRLRAVAVLAALFLIAAGVLGTILRAKAKARPKPFAATRAELSKDGAMLRGTRE